jgi:hypothetical protein
MKANVVRECFTVVGKVAEPKRGSIQLIDCRVVKGGNLNQPAGNARVRPAPNPDDPARWVEQHHPDGPSPFKVGL